MAVASPPYAGLPGGPGTPRLAQALRYTGRFPELTAEQHARLGASWTLRLPGLPDSVVTADRELVKHVLTGDPLTRRHANDILAPALGELSVMLLEPAEHLQRRKALLPSFHGERVQGYRELMRRLIDADLDGWHGEVRVHDHARALTLEVIQQAVFGTSDARFVERLTRVLDTFASPAANLGLFAPALTRRSRWNLPAEYFHRQRDRLDALMDEWIASRRTAPAGDDILSMLLESGLSDAALNDELKTLLVAGHETTATAIAWAADLLAHRPAAADRIRAGDRAYLAAAAKEVLRMRTVVPVTAARTLLEPALGLPAGTVVLLDAYWLHRDPDLHPAPGEFRPERFLDGGPPSYSYLPFGGGAHRCVGAALASLELETALEAITTRFDLAPTGPPERPARRGPTLVPARGARVRVRPRARARG